MSNTVEIKNFETVTGLGTITFSPELITSIIKKVLKAYPRYAYKNHSISQIRASYYEVSIVLSCLGEINFKEMDRLQKELLIVLKQSLSLTCTLFININNE